MSESEPHNEAHGPAPAEEAAKPPAEEAAQPPAQETDKPPFPRDDPFLQDSGGEDLRGAPRCVGLFIIMAIVYFFNFYCTLYILPRVEQNFKVNRIPLTGQQDRFLAVSHKLVKERFIGYLPVLVIMALGILSLVTRYWGVFSGVFFTFIVLQFLLFLYGWVIFALPLIQLAGSSGA